MKRTSGPPPPPHLPHQPMMIWRGSARARWMWGPQPVRDPSQDALGSWWEGVGAGVGRGEETGSARPVFCGPETLRWKPPCLSNTWKALACSARPACSSSHLCMAWDLSQLAGLW